MHILLQKQEEMSVENHCRDITTQVIFIAFSLGRDVIPQLPEPYLIKVIFLPSL